MQTRLRLISSLLVFVPVCIAATPVHVPATLHIKHEKNRASLRAMFKVNYDLCVTSKQIYQNTKRTHPDLWALQEPALRKEKPHYQVDAALAPQPEWNKLFIDIQEEYFAGKSYASYTTMEKYTLLDDGTCKVVAAPQQRAEIEDAQYRYDLDLTKSIGTKYSSAGVLQQQSEARLRAAMQTMPGLDKAIADGAVNAGIPQAAVALKPVAAGSETILGQRCDYLTTPLTGKTKACYWSALHAYPGSRPRAVILKMIVPMGNIDNIEQAVVFDIDKPLPAGVFAPPARISLRDRSRVPPP